MTELLPPLGVTPSNGGVDVRIYSQHATKVAFCLFDGGSEMHYALEQQDNRVHAGRISGAMPGMAYGLRCLGPYDPPAGHLFDQSKLLVDPLARQVDKTFRWHPDLATLGKDTAAIAPRGIITEQLPAVDRAPPHWPRFIYELQVRSFSKLHPDIPPQQRGTVAALGHPAVIEHLKRLGVDTIEIMPLMAWADERHLAKLGLRNAWGYNPYCFAAPDPRLAPGGWPEVRQALAALHAAGFQAILDVVFNHSGESDLGGPTLSLRGLDNASYYRHAAGQLVNDTGCGNTLATDHPAVISMILQSMRIWAEAGFDGFRYDLATVMGRNADGFSADAPLLQAITSHPQLGKLIHIAEPWDIGPGGYQLGKFPAGWGEWNDHFRDDVRRFWRGDGSAGDFATQLAGSSDLFNHAGRKPSASINFVAAHDGFTLSDCVQYDGKRNHANGESNRDGNGSEICWVAGRPERDQRALLASLLLARGTPMLTAGDEFGRSQRGNNNAYAQDNETSWLDWPKADAELATYVSDLAELRQQNADYFADSFLSGQIVPGHQVADIAWLDGDGVLTDWQGEKPVLGMALASSTRRERLVIYFNRSHEDGMVHLPPAQAGLRWPEEKMICPARGMRHVLEIADAALRSPQASDGDVQRLANAAGIQGEWWEVNGTHHAVSLETKRALLAAMGLEAKTHGDVRDHLWSLRALADSETAEACHSSPLLGERRVFGLSAHLYALRHEGDWGIGDFETLAQTAEATAAMGGVLLGLNPMHQMFTDDRERVSPYQPSDRRFIDPIYIDVKALNASGQKPPGLAALRKASHVDYSGVWRAKDKALRSIFKSFKGSTAFDQFVTAQGKALQDHARYESRNNPANARYVMWLQWVADQQLAAAASRAKEAGLALGLYRDLALGCAYEGGEVWADPELYSTAVSLGSPPDPFSADGQVWNLPPFNPLQLARRDYQPFAEVLRANMRHAGVLRIDHVLGLSRQFWVPRGASGADGAYVSMPVNKLMSVVAAESRRASCAVIGEDLGTVPAGFRDKLRAANMLSYRVLWFEQDQQGFAPPESYPRQAAVCLSSHDLLPFRGWEMTVPQDERKKLVGAVTAKTSNTGDLLADAHEFVARTPCSIMLVQADDLSGETEPLNVPGTDKERPNWRRRLSVASSSLPSLPVTQAVLTALRKGGRLP